MAEKTFKLEIVAPDRIFYEGDAVMIELNTTEGEIGVYADHIPMTMIIAPGVLTITELEGTKKASLISGFMEIQKDKIVILAETVEWPGDIDKERAHQARERAQELLAGNRSEIDVMRAEAALKRALVRESLFK